MRRRQREPLREPESLDAILARAGESRFVRVKPVVPPKVWRDAVGFRIAERASPVALDLGVLVLRVPSSAWAHELSLLSDDICERLRSRGVDVQALRFRVGAVPSPERPPERRAARSIPAEQPLPEALASSLEAMEDGALRTAVARAAAANLAWRSYVEAPTPEVSEARRAARAPRGAEAETAPQVPASTGDREGATRTSAGARGRPR